MQTVKTKARPRVADRMSAGRTLHQFRSPLLPSYDRRHDDPSSANHNGNFKQLDHRRPGLAIR